MALCDMKRNVPTGEECQCPIIGSLPEKATFAGVDALTMVAGNILLLKWTDRKELDSNQRIALEGMTSRSPTTVMIIEGDPESMAVDAFRTVHAGTVDDRREADLDDVHFVIKDWSDWALANPAHLTSNPHDNQHGTPNG